MIQDKQINAEVPIGVKVHPIALLAITDHFERSVGNKKNKRVIGALLGDRANNVYEVTNAFAIPYDEDNGRSGVYFLDQNFTEIMYEMFKKIDIKEKILGWYCTTSDYASWDIEINEFWSRYCPTPVYLLVDLLKAGAPEPPLKAYYSRRSYGDGGKVARVFTSIGCRVAADDAEEVGVEHLLRDVQEIDTSSLSGKVGLKLKAFATLSSKISKIINYLDNVSSKGQSPKKEISTALHAIVSKMSLVLDTDLEVTLSRQLNDNYSSILLGNLSQNICNLHELLNNRIKNLSETAPLAN